MRCFGFLLVAACAALSSTPAYAQQIKPLTVEQDPNGVDMLSGKASARAPTMSIPAAPRLAYTRGSDWYLFLEGRVTANTFGGVSLSMNTLNGTSESINCQNFDVCRDQKDGGASVSGSYQGEAYDLYLGGSNTKITYDIRTKNPGPINSSTNRFFYLMASEVKFADGETLTFAYDSHTDQWGITDHRPTSITSSVGYRLELTYQSQTAGTGLWRTVDTAKIVKTSAPSTALASHSYSGTAITDIAGRQFNCSGCNNNVTFSNSLVSEASLQLPGEALTTYDADATTKNHGNNYTHDRFTTRVTVDGVQYDYSYLQGGYNSSSANPDLVDEATITGPNGFFRKVDVEIQQGSGQLSRIKSVTNSLGNTTSYQYAGTGGTPSAAFLKLTKITYPELNSVEIGYDGPVNITEMRMKAKPGSGLSDIIQTAYFGNTSNPVLWECQAITCYLPVWTQDANGNQTDYSWSSSHGGLLTQLDPANGQGKRRKTKNTYDSGAPARLIKSEICEADSSGNELTCGTAQSFVTEQTYFGDTLLPLTMTLTNGVGAAPLTTTYTYDAAGRLLIENGPLPGEDDATFYRYDAIGRRTWVVGPRGGSNERNATRTTYRLADEQPLRIESGRLASINNPYDPNLVEFQIVETTYNSRRLPTKSIVRSAIGSIFAANQTSYDARNRKSCSTIRINPATLGSLPDACDLGTTGTHGPDRITRTLYDAESRVTQMQQGFGTDKQRNYATYTYTPNGQQASMTDARGYRAEMRYDGFDRQSHWYFPHPQVQGMINTADFEQYGYDTNGNRTSLRKRDGSVLTYAFDGLNQMTRKTVPQRANLSATLTRDVFYEYDIRGLPAKSRFDALSGEGVTTSHDQYGRTLSENLTIAGGNWTVNSGYDAGGRRTSMQYPDGPTFSYSYHADG